MPFGFISFYFIMQTLGHGPFERLEMFQVN